MRWVKRTLFLTLFFVIANITFNILIDPYGKFYLLNSRFNRIKIRLDERLKKFNHLTKNTQYTTLIFGSSRTTALAPDAIANNSYNSSFSAATIDEIYLFLNFFAPKMKLERVVIGIDLFGLAGDFKSNGTMPLSLHTNFYDYLKLLLLNLESSLSVKTTLDSFKTINHNYRKRNTPEELNNEFTSKGMRHYREYLKCKESSKCMEKYINVHFKNKDKNKYWHVSGENLQKILYLERILSISKKYQFELITFMTPLLLDQIRNGKSNYLHQIKAIELIVQKNITFFDCNIFSEYLDDYNYFVDIFHFNYDIANLVTDALRERKDNEICKSVNQSNLKEHKNYLIQKLNSL